MATETNKTDKFKCSSPRSSIETAICDDSFLLNSISYYYDQIHSADKSKVIELKSEINRFYDWIDSLEINCNNISIADTKICIERSFFQANEENQLDLLIDKIHGTNITDTIEGDECDGCEIN